MEHVLCCDCDDCLNGSGGLVLPGAGVAVEEPGGERRAAVAMRERERIRESSRRQREKRKAAA